MRKYQQKKSKSKQNQKSSFAITDRSKTVKLPQRQEEKLTADETENDLKWFEQIISRKWHDQMKLNRMEAAHKLKINAKDEVEGMTALTRKAIMQRKFDYATLSACISDIRKKFWDVKQTKEDYKRKLLETHSHFYQQLIPGRTEQRIEMANRLKKGGFIRAMNLVDGDLRAKQKKKASSKQQQYRFDSGSEGESRRPMSDGGGMHQQSESDRNSDQEKSWDSRVSVDLDYKPNLITKDADILDQADQQSQLSFQYQINNNQAQQNQQYQPAANSAHMQMTTISSAKTHKFNQSDYQHETYNTTKPQQHHHLNYNNTYNFKISNFQQQSQEFNLDTEQHSTGGDGGSTFEVKGDNSYRFDEVSKNQNLTNIKAKSLVLNHGNSIARLKPQLQMNQQQRNNQNPKRSGKTGSAKGQRRRATPGSGNSATGSNNGEGQVFFYAETSQEFLDELMSDSDLSKITFSYFDKMMRDQEICSELSGLLSINLHDKHGLDYDFEEIQACLPYVDKALFVGFRNGRVTMAQLKARVAEKRGFAKYRVLEDIYGDLSTEELKKLKSQKQWAEFIFGKNPKQTDYSRQLEPWEANPRCLRSIKYHHQKRGGDGKSTQPSGAYQMIRVVGRNQKNDRSVGVTSDTNTTTLQQQEINNNKSCQMQQLTQAQSSKTEQWNSLIDENTMTSKKNRLTKEVELRKHLNSLNMLKKKFAKQIVNQTCQEGDLKQLTIEDFFQLAGEMEKERNEQMKIKMNMSSNKAASSQERDQFFKQQWQRKVNANIQAVIQHYSSNFDLPKDLNEEQLDLARLKLKLTDPYAYFQERQNQLQKAYQHLNDCQTVQVIENEITDAQNYLAWADQHHEKKRYSPTQAEYNYIKRLVDDGQPVVLTKQLRKALKIKDEQQTLEKAMKEDLQEAGLKQREITATLEGAANAVANGHLQIDDDDSDVDSADRRKRKLLLETKGQKTLQGASGGVISHTQIQIPKNLSRKERAKQAYKAERERQKLMRPRTSISSKPDQVWRRRRSKQQNVEKITKNQDSTAQNDDSTDVYASSKVLGGTSNYQSLERFQIKNIKQSNRGSQYSTAANSIKKIPNQQQTVIKVNQLPKYLSSKLITRNQSSNIGFPQSNSDDVIEAGADGKHTVKQQNNRDAIKNNFDETMRSTTLKGQDIYAEKPEKASIMQPAQQETKPQKPVDQQSRIPLVSNAQNSGYKPINQNINNESLLRTQRQAQSTYQLNNNLSQTTNTARTAAAHHFQQRPKTCMTGQQFEEESRGHMTAEELQFLQYSQLIQQSMSGIEQQLQPDQRAGSALKIINQTEQNSLENSMSQTMLDFVHLNGITVKNNNKLSHSNKMIDNAIFSNAQSCDSSVYVPPRSPSNNPFRGLVGKARGKQHGQQLQTAAGIAGRRSTTGGTVRATTAQHHGSSSRISIIHNRRERQDLDFNSRPQAAEQHMKEQKLLLFQQKLDKNQANTATSTPFLNRNTSKLETTQELAKKAVAQIMAIQAPSNKLSRQDSVQSHSNAIRH